MLIVLCIAIVYKSILHLVRKGIIMFLDPILGVSSTVCRAFPWLWLFSIKRYILPNVIFVFY